MEIYLKAGEEGRIRDLSFTGQGDIISQGATSMVLEQVLEEGLTMEEVLALDYEEFVDRVGREAVGSRTRNTILGLSTLKSAVRKLRETTCTLVPLAPNQSAKPHLISPQVPALLRFSVASMKFGICANWYWSFIHLGEICQGCAK